MNNDATAKTEKTPATTWQASAPRRTTTAMTPIATRELHGLIAHALREKLARKKIGDAAVDSAFARGSALTVEDLLALALREGAHPVAESEHASTGLTRREREVADLVADGMSNRDLAARLVVSPRTAEAHVQHILTKPGFNSRAQIASWVAQQRADRS